MLNGSPRRLASRRRCPRLSGPFLERKREAGPGAVRRCAAKAGPQPVLSTFCVAQSVPNFRPRRPPCSRLLLLLACALLPPQRTRDISVVHSRDGLVVLLPRCHSVPSRALLAVINFASSNRQFFAHHIFSTRRNPSLSVITSAKPIRKMDPKPEPLPSDFPPLYSRVFSSDDSTA